jgi:hypothetical protein
LNCFNCRPKMMWSMSCAFASQTGLTKRAEAAGLAQAQLFPNEPPLLELL